MSTTSSTDFICDCSNEARSACQDEPFFKEYEGKRYCVLHYPAKDKLEPFRTVLKRKLVDSDFNFNGTWFPEAANFENFHFNGVVDFRNTTFKAEASFDRATFGSVTTFADATFGAGIGFLGATFQNEISFKNALFHGRAIFMSANFHSEVEFIGVKFTDEANFSGARFSKEVTFANAQFLANTKFVEAYFSGEMFFGTATFYSAANFLSATFSNLCSFANVTFVGEAKFSSTNFLRIADFSRSTFSAAAIFGRATFFKDANFNKSKFNAIADFCETTFKGLADFYSVIFESDGRFSGATFEQDANFHSVTFNRDARFGGTVFGGDARFDKVTFNAMAKFKDATFKGGVRFRGIEDKRSFGNGAELNFESATFEKPERISFHTLDLFPGWFLNVDPRKFEFTDVQFKQIGRTIELRNELVRLKNMQVSAPHRLFEIACRQLADNAEINHRYQEASRFRYSAFECRRIEKFWGVVPFRLDFWYWLASGYGERIWQAFLVFILLLGVFAFGYKNAEFEPPSKTISRSPAYDLAPLPPSPMQLSWEEAARYSFNVAILQKPEPKPRGKWGWLVSLETLLGPAQAALLALAVRRRFMR